MILIVIAILLFAALLVWLWRGPVSKSVDSLQAGGSSKTESYVLLIILSIVLFGSAYLILMVV